MPSNSKLVHWVVLGGLAVVVLAIGFAFVREQSAPAPPRLAKQELPVISQLSDALGVTPPRVYVDAAIKGVALGDGQTPFIRISAEVQADPAVPSHRAALGRAIP